MPVCLWSRCCWHRAVPAAIPATCFRWAATAITPTSGPDSFLLFPNPQKQADGSLQTNTTAYATAYYAAIDPTNAKDTLDKWKAANGFGNSATGTETTVVFGDVRDLGYGRRITARKTLDDGTIAVMVENYLVSPAADYTYSSFNLDAAVVRDQRWHVGTNAIEFSAASCTASDSDAGVTADLDASSSRSSTPSIPTTGQRLLAANLDGRGDKAMPGICITCHGGRGDPLTPAAGSPTGLPLFPWVGNSASQKRGDVQAHLQPLIVDSFGYSTTPGYTRADQEAALKTINQLVLCSYPVSMLCNVSDGLSEDASRRVIATANEWDGQRRRDHQGGLRRRRPAQRDVLRHLSADWLAGCDRWDSRGKPLQDRGRALLPHLPYPARRRCDG